jgi:hypothetical protein
MAGFLEAYTNAESLKIKLIFGLRLTFCLDHSNKSEEGRANSYKNIIFAKNAAGYKQLIKIYTFAAQEGFYYEPRIDFKALKSFWTKDLLLAVPFYDSFLYNNKYTASQCVPDFSFTEPVFFLEDNDTLLDKDMQERVADFCADKYKIIHTKSIYYKNKKDFSAYLTFRAISARTTVEKPNLDGMCSDEFSIESWCKKTGAKIKQKEPKTVEKKPEETTGNNKIDPKRLSNGIVEFNIPDEVIKEAEERGKKLGVLRGSILKGKGNTTGYVGQIMFQKIFGGTDTDEESNVKKFRFDVSFNNEGWEIKTKNTTMDYVSLDFDASISCNTKQQKFDKVVFFRVNLESRKGWYGGYATYDQWMENRFFAKKGQIDPTNGMEEWCDCHKMKYGSMLALPNPQLEIITNG